MAIKLDHCSSHFQVLGSRFVFKFGSRFTVHGSRRSPFTLRGFGFNGYKVFVRRSSFEHTGREGAGGITNVRRTTNDEPRTTNDEPNLNTNCEKREPGTANIRNKGRV
jgi:hypothetical protein